jgi:uncharacterized membrane protein YoaK (UPF0700 family)
MLSSSKMKLFGVPGLLSFNGGFVDTVGFLGLQGLFTAHVTGNFVTLAAALVLGTKGVVAKLLALPEFIVIVAVTQLAGAALTARGLPSLRFLVIAKVLFFVAFFALCVAIGPFPDSDATPALVAGFCGIAAMGIQNAVQRIHLSNSPPTTLMTGNTTQLVLDVVDLASGANAAQTSLIKGRFWRMFRAIGGFGAGCAVGALLYYLIGFWCLAVPVMTGIVTAVYLEGSEAK